MNNIPMSIFPLKVSKVLAKPFLGFSELVQKLTPNISLQLEQTGSKITADTYISVVLLNSFIYFLIFTSVFYLISDYAHFFNPIIFGVGLGLFFAGMFFVKTIFGLTVEINKRVKSINANLIFGLKMLLVELSAGVTLFDSIVIVATHNLGELSHVFKEIAKRLNSGEKEEEVLKDIATKNPSPFLKKVLWQMVSGLKSGAPINKVIDESLLAIERQQKTEIVGYGSSLKVLTLMYMMMGVIIPAMGLSFLIVINSLPGFSLGVEMLFIFIAMVIVFQFMIIGFTKSKRPSLMGSV